MKFESGKFRLLIGSWGIALACSGCVLTDLGSSKNSLVYVADIALDGRTVHIEQAFACQTSSGIGDNGPSSDSRSIPASFVKEISPGQFIYAKFPEYCTGNFVRDQTGGYHNVYHPDLGVFQGAQRPQQMVFYTGCSGNSAGDSGTIMSGTIVAATSKRAGSPMTILEKNLDDAIESTQEGEYWAVIAAVIPKDTWEKATNFKNVLSKYSSISKPDVVLSGAPHRLMTFESETEVLRLIPRYEKLEHRYPRYADGAWVLDRDDHEITYLWQPGGLRDDDIKPASIRYEGTSIDWTLGEHQLFDPSTGNLYSFFLSNLSAMPSRYPTCDGLK